MTNGDRIRQMSNEELMEWMCAICANNKDECEYNCNSDCKADVKAYLDMEVE